MNSDGINRPASIASALETIANAQFLSDTEIQRLLELAVRAYSARALELRAEGDGRIAAFPAGTNVSATEAMITSSAMLKAVNVQVFELGMYQAWAGT